MKLPRINWRFLAAFLLASGLAVGGYSALHAYQVRRQAKVLPALAERYAAEGKTARALRTLTRYLLDRPGDDEARLQYARILLGANPDPAGRSQAAEMMAAVLASQPGRDDVRGELARMLVEARLWADARPHLEHLAAGGDRWAVESLGRTYAALRAWPDVDRLLTPVCVGSKSPAPSDYARLAEARRRLGRAAEADAVMEKLAKDHADAAEAFLVRAGYRELYPYLTLGVDGAPDQAKPLIEADLEQAKRLAPADPAVALARATRALHRRDPAAAAVELRDALNAHPDDVRLLRVAAAAEAQAGRPGGAVALLRRAAAAKPHDGLVAVNLAQTLVDAADWEAARAQLKVAEALRGADAGEIELLSARLTLEAGDWPKASAALDALRPKFAAAKKPTEPIDALMARCAGLAGDTERQLTYARRAAGAEEVAGRLVLASSLAEAGRLDEAADTYRLILREIDAPPSAAFGLAQLLVIRFGLPGSGARDADWAEVDRLLERAGAAAPDAWEVPVLRAESLLTRDKPLDARRVLDEARAARPKELAIWAASAAAEARVGRLKEADALLTEGMKQAGDSADLRLTRLRIRFAGEGDKSAALEEVGRGIDGFPPDDLVRIWSAQAEGYELLGRPADAAAVLDKVLAARPNDLRSLLTRFDVAVRLKDDPATDRALAEIRRLDGARGAFAEYVAAYRVVRAVRGGTAEKGLLAEARRHLAEAASRRPGWAKAALLRAEVEELDGNADRAADAFREAFDGGERSFALLRRLVEYYSERRRFAEADDLIKRIQEKGRLNPAQSRTFAEVYLQALDYARAVELAKQAVADDSKNPSDFLWLARVSLAARRPAAEVEAALRKAIGLAGGAPEPWAALVSYLAATGRKADAQLVLTQIATSTPPDKASVILAPCYEAIGDLDKAEAAYLKATGEKPADLRLAQGAAAFFARTGRWAKAEGPLRGIVEGKVPAPPADVASARRDLAVALAALGPSRAAEAMRLLDLNLAGGPAPADSRARAQVLAQNRMTQRAAFDLLDGEFSRRPLAAADLFLYARLAWATEQPARASQAMLALLGAEGDNVEYLAFWVNALLGRGELPDADFWLAKLAKARPDALGTVRLQAILAFKRGRPADAASRLAAFDPKTAADLGQLATAHEEVDDFPGAEARFRAYAQRVNTSPARLALARYLGRRGRYPEALDLAEAARADLPTDLVATVAMDFLRNGDGPPGADQVRRVERWLADAPPPKERPWQPLWLLAELADIRADTPEAIARFRKALALAPAQPLVVPGLARLLCLTGGPAEASEAGRLSAEASKGAPVNADELAELEGLALLKQGQAAKAVERLKAVGTTAPSPRGGFYLAAALLELGQKAEAVSARQLAIDRGLKQSEIHPLERTWWKKLSEELSKK